MLCCERLLLLLLPAVNLAMEITVTHGLLYMLVSVKKIIVGAGGRYSKEHIGLDLA